MKIWSESLRDLMSSKEELEKSKRRIHRQKETSSIMDNPDPNDVEMNSKQRKHNMHEVVMNSKYLDNIALLRKKLSQQKLTL